SLVSDPGAPNEPPLVNYHYCSPDRPLVNCTSIAPGTPAGVAPYTYDPAWVHPHALDAVFEGCPTEDEQGRSATHTTQYQYTWEVFDSVSGVVSQTFGPYNSCADQTLSLNIDPDTGSAPAHTSMRLTIRHPNDATPILGSPFVQPVVARDILIASLGDSYG